MLLSIGALAAAIGISVTSLRRWDKSGQLKPHLRTIGGHRRYLLADVLYELGCGRSEKEHSPKLIVGYARVSSHDQADDLVRQTRRLQDHLADQPQALLITDLGSGLNFKKRGLSKLIGLIIAGQVERVVITHKDRLMRFGFELMERLVHFHGGTIEVLENVVGNDDAELAKDVLTIITVFSAKLYGRRAHQNRRVSSAHAA